MLKKFNKIYFYQNSVRIFFYIFVFFLILQILFWQKTHQIKPNYKLIPDVQNKYLTEILSFGDKEFLYRANILRLQNAGDIFAGFVALKFYDYNKLYQWFNFLDELNDVSDLTPSLAAYIFANSSEEKNIRLIIKYLKKHGQRNLNNNWWWIFQAIYLASNVLQDNDLALKLANILSQNQDLNAPLWTKQIPAFIHAKKGDGCAAFFIIKNIIDEVNSKKRQASLEEIKFMRYFINVRLKKLKNNKFDPKNCKN